MDPAGNIPEARFEITEINAESMQKYFLAEVKGAGLGRVFKQIKNDVGAFFTRLGHFFSSCSISKGKWGEYLTNDKIVKKLHSQLESAKDILKDLDQGQENITTYAEMASVIKFRAQIGGQLKSMKAVHSFLAGKTRPDIDKDFNECIKLNYEGQERAQKSNEVLSHQMQEIGKKGIKEDFRKLKELLYNPSSTVQEIDTALNKTIQGIDKHYQGLIGFLGNYQKESAVQAVYEKLIAFKAEIDKAKANVVAEQVVASYKKAIALAAQISINKTLTTNQSTIREARRLSNGAMGTLSRSMDESHRTKVDDADRELRALLAKGDNLIIIQQSAENAKPIQLKLKAAKGLVHSLSRIFGHKRGVVSRKRSWEKRVFIREGCDRRSEHGPAKDALKAAAQADVTPEVGRKTPLKERVATLTSQRDLLQTALTEINAAEDLLEGADIPYERISQGLEDSIGQVKDEVTKTLADVEKELKKACVDLGNLTSGVKKFKTSIKLKKVLEGTLTEAQGRVKAASDELNTARSRPKRTVVDSPKSQLARKGIGNQLLNLRDEITAAFADLKSKQSRFDIRGANYPQLAKNLNDAVAAATRGKQPLTRERMVLVKKALDAAMTEIEKWRSATLNSRSSTLMNSNHLGLSFLEVQQSLGIRSDPPS